MASSPWPLLDRSPPLGPDDVHVWQASLAADEDAEARYAASLSADERDRAARFRFRHDRRQYIVARGQLRCLLGDYLSLEASEVQLAASDLGKPRLRGELIPDVRFNIAHSADLALFAFGIAREIGVDVEFERTDVDFGELAQRFFAAEEVAAIPAYLEEEGRSAFYRCWTRKEAYVKGLGLGLQVPLDGFAVSIDAHPRLIHTSHDPDQRDRWSLCDLAPAPGYSAAMAVEGSNWQLFCGRRTRFL